MYYGECIRNDSEGIANLFNEHLFNQFSDKSKYDIDINFDKDPWFDLDGRSYAKIYKGIP